MECETKVKSAFGSNITYFAFMATLQLKCFYTKNTCMLIKSAHKHSHTRAFAFTVNGFYCFIFFRFECSAGNSRTAIEMLCHFSGQNVSRCLQLEALPIRTAIEHFATIRLSLGRSTTLECFLWRRTNVRNVMCASCFFIVVVVVAILRVSTLNSSCLQLRFVWTTKILCMLTQMHTRETKHSVLTRQTIACVFVYDTFHVEYSEAKQSEQQAAITQKLGKPYWRTLLWSAMSLCLCLCPCAFVCALCTLMLDSVEQKFFRNAFWWNEASNDGFHFFRMFISLVRVSIKSLACAHTHTNRWCMWSLCSTGSWINTDGTTDRAQFDVTRRVWRNAILSVG